MPTLRFFLKKHPQPARLRVRLEDDEERIIELASTHARWRVAEDAVTGSRAVHVECLDGKGTILRSMKLRDVPAVDEGDEGDGEDADVQQQVIKTMGRERRELAGIIDRYGDRLNEAFSRGVEAASRPQEHLVADLMALVDTLTNHFAIAISNIHSMSVNVANLLSMHGQAGGEVAETSNSGNKELLEKVLGMAAMKVMGEAPNGKKDKDHG